LHKSTQYVSFSKSDYFSTKHLTRDFPTSLQFTPYILRLDNTKNWM